MNQKIGSVQASMLLVSSILPTEIVVLPSIIGNYAEQDSPLSVILSSVGGLFVAITLGALVKASKGTPFLNWVSSSISPVVAFILGLVLLNYYLDTTASIFREFINFMKDNILMNSPVGLMTAIVTLVSLYIATRGVDAIARINSLIVIFTIIFIPIYVIGLSKYIDFHRLLPMFDHPFSTVVLASLTPVSWLSESAVILFLAPYLRHPQKGIKISCYALLGVFIFMFISMIIPLAVYGTGYIQSSTYPLFSAIGIIQYGDFFENLDVLFISYWIMSVYMKMGIFIFATIQCFKQTFRIKKNSPYSLGLALVVAVECMYTWKSPSVLNTYNVEARFPVFMFTNFLVPLTIYLWFRGKKAASGGKKTAAKGSN